jgi:hypothetical protein
MRLALLVVVLGVVAASARQRDARRSPDPAGKCGRMVLAVAHRQPGATLQAPPECGHVQVPSRYEVRQGAGPTTVDLYLRGRKLATLIMREAPAAPQLTIIDKRPTRFATTRWTRAGVEFVSVTPRRVAQLAEEEAIQ